MNVERIGDLTPEELRALVYDAVRQAMHEVMAETQSKASTTHRPPLDIPVLDVGTWPEGLKLVSREEMYGDDGR